jgi:diguanylate cyclase (GGDEF)-like protein
MGSIPKDSAPIREQILAAQLCAGQSRAIGIFDDIDLVAVSHILERCSIRGLAAGEVLLNAGESNRVLYFVLSGSLSIHLESKESDPVAVCTPGQAVGELSVIDGNPASAFVLAKTDTRLLAMVEENFWSLVRISHAFAVNLIILMASRMRETNFTLSQGQLLKKSLEHDAMFDQLTNLHNRRWMDMSLTRILQRHQRDDQPLSVIMIDIDHFKGFNDAYGHAAGDEVLIMVARTIREQLRPSDPGVRVGGEEILVIFPGTDIENALAAAQRLRCAIRGTSITLSDGRVLPPVTVSAGLAQAGKVEKSADLLARADAALYRAKHNGRDRVER